MKTTIAVLTTTALCGLTLVAEAGPARRDPAVNWRQRNQQERIVDGVRSGELTRREVRTLEWKEARVAELERLLKADGVLTPAERARLRRELNELSADIYRQKHDAQTR